MRRFLCIAIGLAVVTPAWAARDSSGTFTLSPSAPFISGTPISAATANQRWSDVATELTDSLSRSAKGSMLGPLRTTDGLVSAPSLAFALETNTGWYRAAAGDLRFSLLGADRLRLGPAASAPFVFTSPQAAAGTATDFLFNTTATRTAGLLFDFQNNGVSKFTLSPAGAVTVAGDLTVVGTVNGAPMWQRVVATADTSTSVLATPTDIAGLSFAAASGKKYLVRAVLFVYAAATTTGLGVSIKATGAPTTSFVSTSLQHWQPTTSYPLLLVTASFTDTPGLIANSYGIAGTAAAPDSFNGYFVTTSTGTVQLRLKTAVDGSAVTVRAGSYLEWTEF